jgi:helicase required for RNAi-mediated heterochromatin assembly 1
MRPEIREILTPIYGDQLRDHDNVLNRDPIQGMGNINIFWHSHNHGEGMMSDTPSRTNDFEAEMIAKFCEYLVLNGNDPSQITILTFYTGQRSLIARLLHRNPNLAKTFFKVATVDSYQGEENDIVILSLVRSNMAGSIGFLNISNRVCVALSRAQRGFYIFGNAQMITNIDTLWWDVANILNSKSPKKVGVQLPLTCHRHKNRTNIETMADWDNTFGGCTKPCGEKLPCGHSCPNNCHPFEHDDYRCVDRCLKVMPCLHRCDLECWEECYCEGCGKFARDMELEAEESEEEGQIISNAYVASARERELQQQLEVARPPQPPKRPTRTVRTPKVRG